MPFWLELDTKEKTKLLSQAAAQSGLPDYAVEKDWWVTYALQLVFQMPIASYLVFKGGTSLSKGWNLIERFSEDIDLAIDRSFFGLEGELSNSKLKKLRRASCEYMTGDFMEELKKQLPAGLDIRVQHQPIRDSDTDPVVIELHYPTICDSSIYVSSRVLIEIGARSLREPFELRPIHSILHAQYPRAIKEEALIIPVVLPKRTFLEKAFLLHEEFQKPTEAIRVDRLSRHLYDLERLMDTEHAKDALSDHALYQSIITHRKDANPVRGIDYASHQPDKINFIPPQAIRKAWQQDYKSMQENMIYGHSLSFAELIKRLEQLQERFRQLD